MKWFGAFLLLAVSGAVFAESECPHRDYPPGLGGVVNDEVSLESMRRWKQYRADRVEERMLLAYDPISTAKAYQVSQASIDQGCVSQAQLVDLGRALFLRDFDLGSRENSDKYTQTTFHRFSQKATKQPHATSCVNCHWKGGFAGAGDLVDNAFLEGDGEVLISHKTRNPIPLHGAGWVELIAKEMTSDLQAQVQQAVIQSGSTSIEIALSSKGVNFGSVSISPTSEGVKVNFSKLEGVDHDLVIKPFGWEGSFATIAEMVEWSFATHLGLEISGKNNSEKNDVTQGVSAGQINAVTEFIATLPTPVVEIPTIAGYRPDPYLPILIPKSGPEYTDRWASGMSAFTEFGCSQCHASKLNLNTQHESIKARAMHLDRFAASPKPEIQGSGLAELYLFSDLKRHDMGVGTFITRPLWGLRNSAPYTHDGSANVIDIAIEKHSHYRSEAFTSAKKFSASTEKQKADLRVFLYSLMRAPSIRVR